MTPKELRKSLDLTVEEMAHELGCSKSMVSMLETGKRNPSLATLKNYEVLSGGKITSANFQTKQ